MTRLDIGGGNNPKEGFINIDLLSGYDVIKEGLLFEDNSVDEIYSSHFLEHLSQMPPYEEVQKVIKEMYRVLKQHKKAIIIVPSILWVCTNFINIAEFDRWNLNHAFIYGSQTNAGEFHKSGFTGSRLQTLFRQQNLVLEDLNETYWDQFHQQECIYAEFIKP